MPGSAACLSKALAAGCAVALLFLASPTLSAERGDLASLPKLTSLPDEAFTDTEREAVTAWALAQPAVKARLGTSRTRVLHVGSDHPKAESGPYRRAVLWVRNYDAGNALGIFVNLTNGRIEFQEHYGVQPNEEEIEEGMAILRADAALEDLFADPKLTLMGGFYTRSPYEDDPCHKDICLQFGFMKPSFEKGPARMMIVNLSRQTVANRDFRRSSDPARPPRATAPGGSN